MNFITRKSGIEPKEFRKLFLLILHSFFSGIFVSIFFSVANAEFVSHFGGDFLPLGYLLSGAVGYATVQVYSRLLRKGGYNAFMGGLLILLVCTVVFRLILFFADEQGLKWMSFVIFLFAMPFLFISGLEQSGLLLRIYNIREGKVYAGIINAGGTVASIAGYLSIPALIPVLGSRFDLFYLAIGGMIAAIFFLVKINAIHDLKEEKVSGKQQTSGGQKVSLKNLWKQDYTRYIAICGGIAMMVFYFVDFSFLVNARSLAESPEELASIIGGFFGAIKAVELCLSLLSGRIFRSFGLKAGILILPMLCLTVTAAALLVYYFTEHLFFVGMIFALKFFERSVSKALEEPAYRNLYQLLDPGTRLAALAAVDGIKQLSIILASIILILYGQFMPEPYEKIGLLYITVPFFLFWVFTSRRLASSFRDLLRSILSASGATETSSPYHKLMRVYQDLKNGGEVRDALSGILNFKISGRKTNMTTPSATETDRYVPSQLLKHLVPERGGSRLELQLYKPLMIIPPQEAGFDDPEESELLEYALGENEATEEQIRYFGRKLDEVKTDHDKKLILRILERSSHSVSRDILLNHVNYPDYYIRKEVFRTLEAKDFKFSAKEEIHFRNTIDQTLSDVTFIISILNVIPLSAEFTDLEQALREEENILKDRLLSVLTWKYDRTSVRVIRENIFSGDTVTRTANNILTLELIDNLIDADLKPKLLPVFEMGSDARRLNSLSKWNYFPVLNLKEALIHLLNCDYTKTGNWVRACVLKIMLHDRTGHYKSSLSGFRYHPDPLLRALALEYAEVKDGQTFYPFAETNEKDKRYRGSEIVKLVKELKQNWFYNKMPMNEISRFVGFPEHKKYEQIKEVADLTQLKYKPVFVRNSNVVVEFAKALPPNLFTRHCADPSMFNSKELLKMIMDGKTELFVFSPAQLVNLTLSSEFLLKELASDV